MNQSAFIRSLSGTTCVVGRRSGVAVAALGCDSITGARWPNSVPRPCANVPRLTPAEGLASLLSLNQARLPTAPMPVTKLPTRTRIAVEIVKQLADQIGFVILPRRWVVERFFAWINRNRRLAKDFEATIASATAFLYAASAMLVPPENYVHA